MACPLMFASCHGVRGPLRTALERPALTEGTVPEFRRRDACLGFGTPPLQNVGTSGWRRSAAAPPPPYVCASACLHMCVCVCVRVRVCVYASAYPRGPVLQSLEAAVGGQDSQLLPHAALGHIGEHGHGLSCGSNVRPKQDCQCSVPGPERGRRGNEEGVADRWATLQPSSIVRIRMVRDWTSGERL